MNIESIDINRFHFATFRTAFKDEAPHKQNLPFLCIAQSKVGRYGIKLGERSEKMTLEGGFYLAPSFTTQHLRHLVNPNTLDFAGRYMFLDVIVNKRYRLGDIYELPTVTDASQSKLLDSLFDRYEKCETYCARLGVIYSILDAVTRLSEEKNDILNMDIYTVVEYMHGHYRENASVADMAALVNTSPSNFFNLFRAATGKSPIKYLNDIRLSLACGMLFEPDKSIAEIAEEVGIPDQFYFSRLFRQRYGLSPMQYRKRKFWR